MNNPLRRADALHSFEQYRHTCEPIPRRSRMLPQNADRTVPFSDASTIAATILTKTDRRFGYVAIPLAVLIALSRLYLYVHFPSDVLIAALLGLLIGELTFRYGGRLLDKLPHKIA